MNIGLTCIRCIFNQLEKVIASMGIDDSRKTFIMMDVLNKLASCDINNPPPLVARSVYRKLYRLTGIADPFDKQKKLSNDNALQLEGFARDLIGKNDLPALAAFRIAISGNIIDYAVAGNGEKHNIEQSITHAMDTEIDLTAYNNFISDIEHAGRILYIGDNAGEIVFDKIFLDYIPVERVTFVVRGGHIINDATMEDARYVGLTDRVRVIDTGDSTPGIDLSRCSKTFLKEFSHADAVILKGQGNYETLFDADLAPYTKKNVPLYFLFKVKCGQVANQTGHPEGDIIFLKRTSH